MATKVQEIEFTTTTTQKIEKLKSDIDKHLESAEDLERRSLNISAIDPAKSIDLDSRAQATRRLVGRLGAQLADLRAEEDRERIARRDAVIDQVIGEEVARAERAGAELKSLIPAFAAAWNAILGAGLKGTDIHPSTLPYLQGAKLLETYALRPLTYQQLGVPGTPAPFDAAAVAQVAKVLDHQLAATRMQLDRAREAFRAEGRGETDRSKLIVDTFSVVMHLSGRISEMAEKTGGTE